MTHKKRTWLIGLGVLLTFGVAGLFVAAHVLSKRFEPYIRTQTIQFLAKRFDSDVELTALRISLPNMSPLKLFLKRGRGTLARVEAEGLSMRHKGNRDVPPMFVIKNLSFQVDLGSVFDTPRIIHTVTIDGMDIHIPPKGDRQKHDSSESNRPDTETNVIIEEVFITNSVLTILPRDKTKVPLQFDLHRVKLDSAGRYVAMKYDAELTNAKPPGEIFSKGSFGPWVAAEPGDTPLSGDYDFENADLGVFSGIAGILNSTGRFEGSLSTITVRGEASVPQFRLTTSGNPIRLSTRFEVLVDGTNGDTILKPVNGTLGSTNFRTSGTVIKHEADENRTISLGVTMPNGSLRDVLALGMKGPPFMEGRIFLKTTIDIPPLTGTVREKLLLDGQFAITKAKFLTSGIQDQIDTLSRRGQGQPKNEEIDEVLSGMAGSFKLTNEIITFKALSFAVEGAGVDLAGSYDLDKDVLDFHGALRLQAKVSQTMTGWKRWALKPVDSFFSKEGAGTLLRIQVVGTSKNPSFGRERGDKQTASGTPNKQ